MYIFALRFPFGFVGDPFEGDPNIYGIVPSTSDKENNLKSVCFFPGKWRTVFAIKKISTKSLATISLWCYNQPVIYRNWLRLQKELWQVCNHRMSHQWQVFLSRILKRCQASRPRRHRSHNRVLRGSSRHSRLQHLIIINNNIKNMMPLPKWRWLWSYWKRHWEWEQPRLINYINGSRVVTVWLGSGPETKKYFSMNFDILSRMNFLQLCI